jgi:hypothetical protein
MLSLSLALSIYKTNTWHHIYHKMGIYYEWIGEVGTTFCFSDVDSVVEGIVNNLNHFLSEGLKTVQMSGVLSILPTHQYTLMMRNGNISMMCRWKRSRCTICVDDVEVISVAY